MSGIEIKVKYEHVVKDFDDFKRHIRKNAEFGADKALDKAVDVLKNSLKKIINEDIKVFDSTQQSNAEPQQGLPTLNIPKAKNDLIKHVFGQDIRYADFNKASVGSKTVNDNNNVFVVDKGRIRAWQSVSDGSTFAQDEQKFKNRLVNGILIDKKTGKMYKINPNDVKGIKVDCSKDTGETINSENKYQAYKNSNKITRRKEGPDDRLAVWAVKQDDVNFMMRHAVSIDDIIEKIFEQDYDTASALIQKINPKGELNKPLEKIADLKQNKNLPTDVQSYLAILKLITNLKIEKKYLKTTTRYTLFSNYDPAINKNEKFMDALKREVLLWLVSNQDDWYRAMVDQVVKALEQYDSKAKFK